jgi:hypothetical protein
MPFYRFYLHLVALISVVAIAFILVHAINPQRPQDGASSNQPMSLGKYKVGDGNIFYPIDTAWMKAQNLKSVAFYNRAVHDEVKNVTVYRAEVIFTKLDGSVVKDETGLDSIQCAARSYCAVLFLDEYLLMWDPKNLNLAIVSQTGKLSHNMNN